MISSICIELHFPRLTLSNNNILLRNYPDSPDLMSFKSGVASSSSMCLVVSSIEQMSLLSDWCPHITFFNHHWIVFKDFLWNCAHSPLVVIPSLALLAQSECPMPTVGSPQSPRFTPLMSFLFWEFDAFPARSLIARLIHPWTSILLDRNTQSYYTSSSSCGYCSFVEPITINGTIIPNTHRSNVWDHHPKLFSQE